MKIGVYGDSFASPHLNEHSQKITWFNILKKLVPCDEVKTYGYGATSVWYSYKKFLETYQEFDTVIFLVTEPSRYTKKISCTKNSGGLFCNLTSVENELKYDNLSRQDRYELENLRGWYISTDDEYNLQMSEFMLRDMESKHKNIIFFPCFPTSMTAERIHLSKLPNIIEKTDTTTKIVTANLFEILSRQSELLGDVHITQENLEHTSCHMTEEFNNFFAEVIANKILNNVWDWSNFYNVKLNHNYNYYYDT